MKNILSIVFVISLLISCNSTSKKGASTSETSGKENSKNDSLIIKKTYHSNDAIWFVKPLKKVTLNGKEGYVPHGEVKEYYKSPKGAISSITMYKEGKKAGRSTRYYTDGNKYFESPYVNGKLEGVKKKYYKTGELMAEMSYNKGLLGLGTKEYSKEGKLLTQAKLKVWYDKDGSGKVTVYAQAIKGGKVLKRVKFSEGILVDGKYAHKNMIEYQINAGTAKHIYHKPPPFVTVVAKVKTAKHNPVLLSKTMKLE